jgi:hypothetical protein
MKECIRIACKILREKDPHLIHIDLKKDIERVDKLTQRAGGTLRSRQAIAMIIADWIRRNPDENPVYLPLDTE